MLQRRFHFVVTLLKRLVVKYLFSCKETNIALLYKVKGSKTISKNAVKILQTPILAPIKVNTT